MGQAVSPIAIPTMAPEVRRCRLPKDHLSSTDQHNWPRCSGMPCADTPSYAKQNSMNYMLWHVPQTMLINLEMSALKTIALHVSAYKTGMSFSNVGFIAIQASLTLTYPRPLTFGGAILHT